MTFKYLLLCIMMFSGMEPLYAADKAPSTRQDSLVEGLSCDQLSPAKVYQSIRKDAWDPAYHLPVRNWAYSAGLYDLAACWSLARTQRLFFYLARWNEQPEKTSSQQVAEWMDQIRGSSPYANLDASGVKEFPLRQYFLLFRGENAPYFTSSLWTHLTTGLTQNLANGEVLRRNFKSEIEVYQNRRFHDFIRNLKYIVGDGSRSPEKNRNTRNALLRNLEENKLTLLLLRPKRLSQHVVVAKSFQPLSNGDIEISVYDSNSPGFNQKIMFRDSENEFYAPDIIRGLPEVDQPDAPLGIYIVDEDERALIETALVRHYKNKCR
ncbi:MAG: hypothetical protein HUU57_11455 [Bdellovibrio sp.]|nr:hypothetical protein [Bdellovibrio sp.]